MNKESISKLKEHNLSFYRSLNKEEKVAYNRNPDSFMRKYNEKLQGEDMSRKIKNKKKKEIKPNQRLTIELLENQTLKLSGGFSSMNSLMAGEILMLSGVDSLKKEIKLLKAEKGKKEKYKNAIIETIKIFQDKLKKFDQALEKEKREFL